MTRRAALLAVLGVPATAVAAQQTVVVPPGASYRPEVLAGENIGFHVEGTGREGAVKGRFMVKVDGDWKDIELVPRIRIVR